MDLRIQAFLCGLVVASVPLTTALTSPVVKAPAGHFKGISLTTEKDLSYDAFKGIPFALPPVGPLRFLRPVAHPPIDEEYDATEFRSRCVQMDVLNRDLHPGQEDCLFLNIFTPPASASRPGEKKQVFVYIHGGGNINGFSEILHPGTFVSKHDLIVVTTNYRVGMLGFLSNLAPSCPGNLGLWDQIEALKWVKVNIHAFGGDPENVVVGGQSAGGVNSAVLSLSAECSGLFSRVLALSGAPGVAHSMTVKHPKARFLQAASGYGCWNKTETETEPKTDEEFGEITECLRTLPALTFSSPPSPNWSLNFGIVIDGHLFPKSLEELFADESYLSSIKFFERKYLFGFVYDEGAIIKAFFEARMPAGADAPSPREMFSLGAAAMMPTFYGTVSPGVVERLADVYVQDYEVSPYADFMADIIFHLPIYEFIQAASKGRSEEESSVRLFRFLHFPEFMQGQYQGMAHGVELAYLFDDFLHQLTGKLIDYKINCELWNERDDQMKEAFMEMLAAFLHTGDPNQGLQNKLPSPWPAYDHQGAHYLSFSPTPTLESHFRPHRMRLLLEDVPAWEKELGGTAGVQKEEL